jgi:dodecin
LAKTLPDHVYKTVDLVGSSSKGPDDAVRMAIAKAGKTVRNMRWFEVVETRGHIENGQIAHWQVAIRLGFTLED